MNAPASTPSACFKCLCDMDEDATSACTEDCWKLAYCTVANGCDSMDTSCIRAACGTALLTSGGATAIDVPFDECASSCFVAPGDAETDAGN